MQKNECVGTSACRTVQPPWHIRCAHDVHSWQRKTDTTYGGRVHISTRVAIRNTQPREQEEEGRKQRWKAVGGKKKAVLSVGLFAVLCLTAKHSNPTTLNEMSKQSASASDNQQVEIKLTIATAGPMLEPPTDRYRVGEQVPITITLTNTSNKPVYTCESGDFYQDFPHLTKDGKVIPFTDWQAVELKKAQQEQMCQRENLPEMILLQPNEPTLVDWLLLVDDSRLPMGGMPWYDQLTPGEYKLSIQRRFDCCDGPMIESNDVSFEVVP